MVAWEARDDELLEHVLVEVAAEPAVFQLLNDLYWRVVNLKSQRALGALGKSFAAALSGVHTVSQPVETTAVLGEK